MNNLLSQSLSLPCGAVLKNRIAKSAMSETLGTRNYSSDERMVRLYQRWAEGGSGLLITGNVMISSTALGEAGNIVIEKRGDHHHLAPWAKAGTLNQTHLWMQINHPGKQSPKFLSKEPVAPSSIPLRPPLDKMFNIPRALTEFEIQEIIQAFAYAAKTAKTSGFTGVQIHGAHGYLVSQFLSPHHNQRNDQWGGTLKNRMRFVLNIYEAIRTEVGKDFPVSIKLNSADFQKGGFTKEESMEVVQNLSELGMDLIEISGGTYEAPVAMTGISHKESTRRREAYFLDYCQEVRAKVKTPLMLTGGFRTLEGINMALNSGACDAIGLARSIAINPDFPNELLEGKNTQSKVKFLTSGFKGLDKMVPLEITWYAHQIHRIGRGLKPKPNLSVIWSIIYSIFSTGFKSIKRVRAK